MRVTPSGLSIGTTSNAAQSLHVVGNAYVSNRIGVANSSPAFPLDVSGTVNISSGQLLLTGGVQDIISATTLSNVGRIAVNANGNTGISLRSAGSEKWVIGTYVTSGTNHSFTFYNVQTGTDAFSVYGDNNYLGLGTITPTQRLHISGNARLTGALYDGTNSAGSSGNILTSTGGATAWKNAASILSGSTYVPTGSADATGNTGDFSYDSNYIYVKTAAGWKRAALSTF